MDFITDILLLELRVEHPVRLAPGFLPTEVAMRTVSEALARAACDVLDLEAGEIQADFRAALTDEGQSGQEAEVYLYDTLPGGAGFARLAGDRADEVFKTALTALTSCDCDVSCYKCLRSFKNKFEHDRLDRHVGADLLRYLIDGTMPVLAPARAERAHDALVEDLRRQGGATLTIECNTIIEVPTIGRVPLPIVVRSADGRQRVICITHPLTAATPSDARLEAVAEYTPLVLETIHEFKVRRNLPRATRDVLATFGEGA